MLNNAVRILLSTVLLLAGLGVHANSDQGFRQVDLDELIRDAKPAHQGTVEILRFHKIKLLVEMASLPQAIKTQYLLETMTLMGVKPLPKVTQGMFIRAASGKTQRVYVIDTVAARITTALKPGQKVLLYGYHAFNSKHGPGILVSGYDL